MRPGHGQPVVLVVPAPLASQNLGSPAFTVAGSIPHSVVSIDRVRPGSDSTSFVEADITRYEDFERALAGCDALVHLAAIASPHGHPD